jgi:hypothetical protein
MPRAKVYSSVNERVAAYRARKKVREEEQACLQRLAEAEYRRQAQERRLWAIAFIRSSVEGQFAKSDANDEEKRRVSGVLSELREYLR